jgi:hypothetical protein
VPGSYPDFVKEAIRNQPEDAIVGIGVAKLASLSQSMTISATRARAEISRQMNSVIRDMVTDFTASSEVDPDSALSYQETITVALSQSKLTGSVVIDQDQDADGRVWTIVSMSKASVANEINQAAAAAKLAVPKMAALDTQSRMDAAFSKIAGEEVVAAEN